MIDEPDTTVLINPDGIKADGEQLLNELELFDGDLQIEREGQKLEEQEENLEVELSPQAERVRQRLLNTSATVKSLVEHGMIPEISEVLSLFLFKQGTFDEKTLIEINAVLRSAESEFEISENEEYEEVVVAKQANLPEKNYASLAETTSIIIELSDLFKLKKARIDDFSSLAGLSEFTVYRYLNGNKRHMRRKTYEKFKNAIQKFK